MNLLFESWRGFLLIEGRKENAAAMIVKKINDPDLREILQTEVLDEIIASDPTPNKKYIEWAARRMAEVVQKEVDDEFMQRFTAAEKDPDGFTSSHLERDGRTTLGSYDSERLEQIKSMDKTQRYQGGYLTNAERLKSSREAVRGIIFAKLQSLRRLGVYHKAAERGLMTKNLDSYKNLYDWEGEVYRAEREMMDRERMKQIERGAKETTEYIQDDDDFMVVRPNSADASCYYGKATKWCISATRSQNYYEQYTNEGVTFYFVLFKHLPQNDINKKLALVYKPGYGENNGVVPDEIFDVEDDPIGGSESEERASEIYELESLKQTMRDNMFAKALKRVHAQKLKKLKGPDRGQYLSTKLTSVRETWDNLWKVMDDNYWQDVVATSTEQLKTDPEDEHGMTSNDWQDIRFVLNELDLDDDVLSVATYDDINEHIDGEVSEQLYGMIGSKRVWANSKQISERSGIAGHLEENPGGPSSEQFYDLLNQYSFKYLNVELEDMSDYGENYGFRWAAYGSVDADDIHEDLEEADIDEVAEAFNEFMSSRTYHYIYEFEGDYNSVRFRMEPDGDEDAGLEGFEQFLRKVEDLEEEIEKVLPGGEDHTDLIEFFGMKNMVSGAHMKTLKEYFDNLELDNFDVDIEDRELSIYTVFNVGIPMPAHLYKGLTAGSPAWTSSFRADINKSPALMAYDGLINQRQTEHTDQLIDHLRNVFDKVFEMYAAKLQSALPGFETKAPEREQTGLIVPDYNINIFRSAHKTQVGPSGLLTKYFLDVRIEADEEEQIEEANLKLIALFLKAIDRKEMIEKIKIRFEEMVQNDVVKNVMPQFKEDGEMPERDPITGKVTSRAEREEAEQQRRSQAVDELSTMFESKKKIKILIKESVPFGGYSPGLAGTSGANRGASLEPHVPSDPGNLGKDLEKVAKAVLHRNNKVLLLRNEKGWDLPGGHVKESEDVIGGLKREVFEETGLTIDNITSLGMRHSNKEFFCASFARDDIRLSEEHSEFAFVHIEKIEQLEELSPHYKKAIMMCLGGGSRLRESKVSKIKIIIN